MVDKKENYLLIALLVFIISAPLGGWVTMEIFQHTHQTTSAPYIDEVVVDSIHKDENAENIYHLYIVVKNYEYKDGDEITLLDNAAKLTIPIKNADHYEINAMDKTADIAFTFINNKSDGSVDYVYRSDKIYDGKTGASERKSVDPKFRKITAIKVDGTKEFLFEDYGLSYLNVSMNQTGRNGWDTMIFYVNTGVFYISVNHKDGQPIVTQGFERF